LYEIEYFSTSYNSIIKMNKRRCIKTEEKDLILFLLLKAGLKTENYDLPENVEEYEGYVMGSIGLGNPDIAAYDGDIIQAKYLDTDNIPVIITLTKDTNGQLLDLDFWKEDFSKLLKYPLPSELAIIDIN
jgi:hypothetical protein